MTEIDFTEAITAHIRQFDDAQSAVLLPALGAIENRMLGIGGKRFGINNLIPRYKWRALDYRLLKFGDFILKPTVFDTERRKDFILYCNFGLNIVAILFLAISIMTSGIKRDLKILYDRIAQCNCTCRASVEKLQNIKDDAADKAEDKGGF